MHTYTQFRHISYSRIPPPPPPPPPSKVPGKVFLGMAAAEVSRLNHCRQTHEYTTNMAVTSRLPLSPHSHNGVTLRLLPFLSCTHVFVCNDSVVQVWLQCTHTHNLDTYSYSRMLYSIYTCTSVEDLLECSVGSHHYIIPPPPYLHRAYLPMSLFRRCIIITLNI